MNLSAMSGANLLAGIVFGTVGFVAFAYGKKQASWKPLAIGIILMAYPYFVTSTVWLWVIGVLLIAALFVFRD